jgi:hypothetical protein
VVAATDVADPPPESVAQRMHRILAEEKEPISVQRLRQLAGLRTATVCGALAELSEQGLICHDSRGYQLKLHFDDPLVSLSPPTGPPGNGNGKHAEPVSKPRRSRRREGADGWETKGIRRLTPAATSFSSAASGPTGS